MISLSHLLLTFVLRLFPRGVFLRLHHHQHHDQGMNFVCRSLLQVYDDEEEAFWVFVLSLIHI